MKKWILAVVLSALLLFVGCNKGDLSISYEKYELENGLDVILHVDDSDPITAVAIQYHVGSNREVPGKTGFAHLFEHMLFQESENIGQDQFFNKIQNAGGTLNGGTWTDGTVYYEVVPKNALEMVLWMESDRMGYMINTVTPSAFTNQQNVVTNEKRQRVDNNAYGHRSYVIGKAVYPEGHPYNWQTIGVVEDINNATVPDVKAFYNEFYGPNNATLVIAGDIDPVEVKALVEKYFAELNAHGDPEPLKPMPVTLDETKKLYHEDNFARASMLTMVWPSVEEGNKDAYALQYLSSLLSDGKKAPLYKVLVKEKNYTSRASAYTYHKELAGEFYVNVTANQGVSLADVENAVFEAFKKFEDEGFSERDVERVKAQLETGFYNGIKSLEDKAFNLALNNVFSGDPGYMVQDLINLKAVTKDDILRVYDKYIKGKNYVATSFIPKGQLDMMAEGSIKADVVEENVEDLGRVEQIASTEEEIKRTPSKIDRSIEPEKGPMPEVNLPEVWKSELTNGIKVYGVLHDELPLVSYELIIRGGHLLDSIVKPGVANLVASLMNEGTKNKTPEELEEEIDFLGASIQVQSGRESMVIAGNCLARNFEKTIDLVEEILLEPRWDEEEFELAKTRLINGIKRSKANADNVAAETFNKLLYGENHIYGIPTVGTVESVENITIDDLKAYYEANVSPSVASFEIAGAVSPSRVKKALVDLEAKWEVKDVVIPEFDLPAPITKSAVYFVDIPGSKQSALRVGNICMKRNDADYYPAYVMNYQLGGVFGSHINMMLREEKGYTYGARSGFNGTKIAGPFSVSTSVVTDATLESLEIIRDLMTQYRDGITEEELEFTKNAILKSNTRRFETMDNVLSMLWTIDYYGKPVDYVKNNEKIVIETTLESHKKLAEKYIHPDKMIYLVVGDAATQLEPLEKLGFGKPILLDL
ncbi:MAG: insulinase family protein [Candidatus Marinimicrobia bacterium]|nr:insulinase family protein [Candidatus Neomarinimicrobiota bacterium]